MMENNFQDAGRGQPSAAAAAGPAKAPVRIIAVSTLFGILGGLLGGFVIAQDRLEPSASVTNIRQSRTLTVSEDSAVVDVVKSAMPAVVSIVVSKDVSKISNSTNPLFDDPWFDLFYHEQQSQPSKPDIQQVAAGSGFFVSTDGVIVTNRHVVEDTQASYTVVTQDGKQYSATVLARDPVDDLALIKVSVSGAPKLALADSKLLQVGQRVIAIGNSLGQYQNTVTSGIVSGIGRTLTAGGMASGSEELENAIQTDAAINPGNSGGPLLNIAGQVVGINTAIDEQGQLVGFALPSNAVSQALASYEKDGRIVRPFLGVRYVMITPSVMQQEKLSKDFGAFIVPAGTAGASVLPGSPAEKAGLQPGDIIISVNGTRVDMNNRLSQVLGAYNAGDTVTITVYRSGQEKNIPVTLGEAKPQ